MADAAAHHENKGKTIAVVIFLVLLALGVGFQILGPGFQALGQGWRSFMVDVGLGMRANPTMTIIILAIPVMLTLGLLFMAARESTK